MKETTTNLSNDEMRETSGGHLPAIAAWFLGGLAYDLIFHTGETIDSFNAGRAEADKMWRN